MNSISYPSAKDSRFESLKPSFLIAFFQQLTSNRNFKELNIYVNDAETLPDTENKSMETCMIFFQAIKPQEGGTGTHYFWKDHTSLDNTCGNYCIEKLERQPVPKTVQALADMYNKSDKETSRFEWIKSEKQLTELDRRLFYFYTEPKI